MNFFGKIFKVWYGHDYVVPKFEDNVQTLEFVNKSPNPDPEYKHDGDSGFDLRAWITEDTENAIYNKKTEQYQLTLSSLDRQLIHTGLYVRLPENCEAQVRSRSGLSLNEGLIVANSCGTVDNKYVGEICIIAANISKKPVTIVNGDRIAQMVICPVYLKELVNLKKVNEISKDTDRGDNGFCSTGVK